MSKFIRSGLLVALWLNVAAAMYYLLFKVVPISVYWQAQIALIKTFWPVYPILAVGLASLLVHNRFAKITCVLICSGAAGYFAVLSNIAMFKILLQHTTGIHLMCGIAWASAACVLAAMPASLLEIAMRLEAQQRRKVV